MLNNANLCLEAGKQVDQEWMSHRVRHLENSLLAEQRFNFIARNDVAFFERFDRKIFAGVSVLRQNYFSEMTASQNAQQTEAVETHSQ